MSEFYDKDYYEDGVCSGKSCYVNYRWMPEPTIKLAYNLIKYLNLNEHDALLDYGCAKGYLVKALRLLDVDAFGCDSSEYAINTVDSDVRQYCKLIDSESVNPFGMDFDWIITKDVLEHMDEKSIDFLLDNSKKHVRKMFHVIPLGDDGAFRIPQYHNDPSHIQIKNEEWWMDKFKENGWITKEFKYKVNGIKDNWTTECSEGNGFFIIEKDIR